jgi:hypothetical protein
MGSGQKMKALTIPAEATDEKTASARLRRLSSSSRDASEGFPGTENATATALVEKYEESETTVNL